MSKNAPFAISEKYLNFILRIKDKILNEDTQVTGIIWGKVGSGKSVRGHEILYLVSGDKANIDKIAFNKDEFIKAVLSSKQEAILGDEGIAIFFSRGAMTKEGRLMAELMAQCRQRNLLILICIPDILNVDSMILSMANFGIDVWESKKKIGQKSVTIKGNMRLWPRFKGNDYLERIIQYLRFKKSNPLKYAQVPYPYLMEAGSPYGEGYKPAFYACNREEYIKKKASILEKYQRSLERKTPNRQIDYTTMDKLIKAKVPYTKIAELLNTSTKVIQNRKTGKHQTRMLNAHSPLKGTH